MLQPLELQHDTPLTWSTGRGIDVWHLFCACIRGDFATVKRLIGDDPSLARCQHAYRTPLYFSVRENRIEITEFLLEHGADPLGLAVNDSLLVICRDRGYVELEARLTAYYATHFNATERGETTAAAIRAHDTAQLRLLLDQDPGLLHVGDKTSNQPIHWATMTRQLDVIDELLARGADINARRIDRARPLQLANGDYHFRGWRDVPADWPVSPTQVITHLRERGATFDLGTACHFGDIDTVRQILRDAPELANRVADYVTYYAGSGAPLRNAAQHGHLEIVQELLAHGADPNLPEEGIAPQGHALYAAVAGRYFDIARLLLERGAYPNPAVESSADALSRAISNNDQPMIELLCQYGAARDVHLLAYYGDVHTAAAMFRANPKLADDPQALANAASEGQEAFVRLMLRYEPRLPERITFPDWAVGAKTKPINDLLFQHGMNANQQNWLHVTPLHHFARRGDVTTAEYFLNHGANLQAIDEDICSTPLGWAAKYGQVEVAKLYLARGALAHGTGEPSWATPLAWAQRRGHTDLARLLESHGAR